MQIKDVDTAKVYAYREGSYGSASPVRVLDTSRAYQKAGNGRYVPVERRTRATYRGSVLLGGYLAVTARIDGGVSAATAALREVTLEQAQGGDLPDGIQVMLLKTARWVVEEYAAYVARLAEEEKARDAWKARQAEMTAQTAAVAEALREAMKAAGFSFPAGYGGGLRVSADLYSITLTMDPEAAGKLTALLRGES